LKFQISISNVKNNLNQTKTTNICTSRCAKSTKILNDTSKNWKNELGCASIKWKIKKILSREDSPVSYCKRFRE